MFHLRTHPFAGAHYGDLKPNVGSSNQGRENVTASNLRKTKAFPIDEISSHLARDPAGDSQVVHVC